MTQVKNIDIQGLKQIPLKSEKHRAIMQAFAERERGRQDISALRLRRMLEAKNIKVSRDDIKSFLEDLQQVGVGKLVSSRGGGRRFIWDWNLKSVAKVALELKNDGREPQIEPQIKPRSPTLPNLKYREFKATNPVKAEILTKSGQKTTAVVTIRKDGYELDFPLDELTNDDFNKIANILRKLSDKS